MNDPKPFPSWPHDPTWKRTLWPTLKQQIDEVRGDIPRLAWIEGAIKWKLSRLRYSRSEDRFIEPEKREVLLPFRERLSALCDEFDHIHDFDIVDMLQEHADNIMDAWE